MKTRRILGSLSALVFLVITTNGSNGQPDPYGIGRAYGSGDILTWWLVLWFLHRKRIYLRV